MKKTEIVFVGQKILRYRWRGIKSALKTLWMALKGYEASVVVKKGEKLKDGFEITIP